MFEYQMSPKGVRTYIKMPPDGIRIALNATAGMPRHSHESVACITVYYAIHNILTSFAVDQPYQQPAHLVNEIGMGVQSVR